jgi:phage-related protein
MFQAISQVFNSIFQMISTIFNTVFTIMKSIINKVIFLIKVGFALLFTFIKALFYKENKMNQHIRIE